MPKMKFYDDASGQWVALDAKDADTVGGKTPAQLLENAKVKSVNGKEGEVLLTARDIPVLESDPDFSILQSLSSFEGEFFKKVDKVSGKGLSTNDYTTTEKNKLAGISAGANNYSHPATHPVSMITGLHNVATSGSYNDLTNKPTIPTNTVSKSGDTMTGILTAQSNTSYTTRQVRNMILSTGDAVSSQMQNGDIWIKYK